MTEKEIAAILDGVADNAAHMIAGIKRADLPDSEQLALIKVAVRSAMRLAVKVRGAGRIGFEILAKQGRGR